MGLGFRVRVGVFVVGFNRFVSLFLICGPEFELVFPYVNDDLGKEKVMVVRFWSLGVELLGDRFPFTGKEATGHEVPSDLLLCIVQSMKTWIECGTVGLTEL